MPRDATHRSPNTDYASRVPIRCPNSRGFPVNAGMPLGPLGDEKPPLCRHIPKESALHVLLAMQKVEGSNPFSRFEEGLHSLWFGQSASAPESPGTHRGPADQPIAHGLEKRPIAGNFRSPAWLTFCFRAFAGDGCWARTPTPAAQLHSAPVPIGSAAVVEPHRLQRGFCDHDEGDSARMLRRRREANGLPSSRRFRCAGFRV